MWKKPGSQKDTGEGKPREFIIYETGVLRDIKRIHLNKYCKAINDFHSYFADSGGEFILHVRKLSHRQLDGK